MGKKEIYQVVLWGDGRGKVLKRKVTSEVVGGKEDKSFGSASNEYYRC